MWRNFMKIEEEHWVGLGARVVGRWGLLRGHVFEPSEWASARWGHLAKTNPRAAYTRYEGGVSLICLSFSGLNPSSYSHTSISCNSGIGFLFLVWLIFLCSISIFVADASFHYGTFSDFIYRNSFIWFNLELNLVNSSMCSPEKHCPDSQSFSIPSLHFRGPERHTLPLFSSKTSSEFILQYSPTAWVF